MAEKNAKGFLKALNENPEILDYLKQYQLPEGRDKEDGIIDVAAHFGYAFSKDELIGEIKQLRDASAAAGEAAKTAVQEMKPEELDAVAGGKTYKEGDVTECDYTGACFGTPIIREKNCQYTFIPKENCWHNDACDFSYRWYDQNRCDSTAKLFQTY